MIDQMQVDLSGVFIALVSAVLSMATAWFSYKAKIYSNKSSDKASKINNAINNRGDGEKTLFELVVDNNIQLSELSAWKDSYENSPWKDGELVAKWISDYERRHSRLHDRIDEIERET